jgi:hypothetical protein
MSISMKAIGDPVTDIAVLLAQSFREDRKQALQASDAAEAARVHEAERQVQEMREQASALRTGGWVKGASMVLSGGCTVAGACLSIGQSDGVAARTTALFSGSGKGVEGIGMGVGESYEATARTHQDEADLHAARSRTHEVAAERYRDAADEAERMIKKAMDFLEQMKESGDMTAGSASAIRG